MSEKYSLAFESNDPECFILKIPEIYRDREWADNNGIIIQTEMGKLIAFRGADNEHPQFIVDFRECRWIDPLPCMSLLMEISYALHRNAKIKILLPKKNKNSRKQSIKANKDALDHYPQTAEKLLLFLKQEGFLESLDKEGMSGRVEYDRRSMRQLDPSKIIPSYRKATCIKMQVLPIDTSITSVKFAYENTKRLLEAVGTKLGDKATPHQRDLLLHKLRTVIQESLQNAHEHAYEISDDYRKVAVYVRYREGGLKQDGEDKASFVSHVGQEREFCPKLDPDWIENGPGCLEVFILDRGIGMVRSYLNAEREITGEKKFATIMRKTYLEGDSTKSPQQRDTAYGGLHLVHNLLVASGDYVRGLDDRTWFGTGVPIQDDRPNKSAHEPTKNDARMIGLAMHYRLSWKTENDTGKHWASFMQGEASELWTELCRSETDCRSSFDWYERQLVIDDRHGHAQEAQECNPDWLLWLVDPHRMKWDILKRVEELSRRVKDGSVLVIADIPSHEAPVYVAAFENLGHTTRPHSWTRKFKYIFLATDRWRFSALKFTSESGSHGYSLLETNEIKEWKDLIPKEMQPKPKNFRLMLVRWIKWHDSKEFWREIESRKSLFIAENVNWSDEIQTIEGYLDFDRALRNFRCMQLMRISLVRVLGVMPTSEAQMHPVDQLVGPVISEVSINDIYEPATDKQALQLLVGSVLVSGATLGTTGERKIHLHFFVHKNCPRRGKESALLFWHPRTPVSDKESKFKRIGRTAIIARGGWKSLELPRFNANDVCIGHRTPGQTYQDLQIENPVIYKAGHWRYEGHHDFLTVNIAQAVETAFLDMDYLARFLLIEILPFIGVPSSKIKQSVFSRLSAEERNSYESRMRHHGLLVYRSHPCTEFIMRRLLETLAPKGMDDALTKIFPVPPIRTRSGGSALLVPPLVRDEIRRAIDQIRHADQVVPENTGRSIPSILIFDDAAITGRTMHDMRAALTTFGAVETDSLVIVNRMRQPADGNSAEFVKYYWRLDVPTMGREGNCPLCHAINFALTLKGSISQDKEIQTLNRWIRDWESVPSLDNWPRGLSPVRLSNPEIEVNFCHRYETGKYLDKIDILHSTGVSTHASEIHTMTSRDDFFIKKIEKHQEPSVRIELAASQLLLFGGEYANDTRIALIRILMCELTRLQKEHSHAFLAGLVSLYGISLFNNVERESIAAMVESVSWSSADNESSRVLLAHLVKEKIIGEQSKYYEIGKRLLKTDQYSLSERFRNIFREIRSIQGNAHSEAIPSLINKMGISAQVSMADLMSAADSVAYLDGLISGIPEAYVVKGRREYAHARERLSQIGKILIETIDSSHSNQSNDPIDQLLSRIQTYAKDYLECIKDLMSCFFFQINDSHDYSHGQNFETVIREVHRRINWEEAANRKKKSDQKTDIVNEERTILFAPGMIDFDTRTSEVWIPWNHYIQRAISDLIKNAVYADRASPNLFGSRTDTEGAHMWIKVDLQNEEVKISLKNTIERADIGYAKGRIAYRQDWRFIDEVGGSVQPSVDESGIFCVEVTIPYAAHMR
jgi:hypothetical protein